MNRLSSDGMKRMPAFSRERRVAAISSTATATQQTPQAPAGKQLAPALRQQIQRPGVQKETPK